MAHDIIKIGLTLVVLALVIAAMALFVSGFLSAYKPGGAAAQGKTYSATGGRSVGAAVPSPKANATMPQYAQYARYSPPGPMIPEPAQPAMEMPMPMGESVQMPSAPPAVTPSKPSYGAPGVPNIPAAPGLGGIIEVLFRLLPLIFHHQYDLAPIWPSLSR